MMCNEETELLPQRIQLNKTAQVRYPHKTNKPPRVGDKSTAGEKLERKKGDVIKRICRKVVIKDEQLESTSQKRQDGQKIDERDRHCFNNDTLLGGRVLRHRRSRRIFDENRHTKRLFTPEIKKYLKEWLIRRREHPYPNREEKKNLAVQTGLTYIQICNWFANWRRKLKNAGSDEQRTWSHLIKSYNTQAEGNVEQISITSDDSIWERRELMDTDDIEDEDDPAPPFLTNIAAMDHSYSVLLHHSGDIASSCLESTAEVTGAQIMGAEESVTTTENQPQCFTISSTTTEDEEMHTVASREKLLPPLLPTHTKEQSTCRSNKYKRHIMEKYMNDLRLDSTVIKEVGERNGKIEASLAIRKRETATNAISSEWEKQYHGRGKGSHCVRQDARKKKNSQSKKAKDLCPPVILSKWLESAAKFQPTKSYVPWNVTKKVIWPKKSRCANITGELKVSPPALKELWPATGHEKAELDAAEALTCLSGTHN